ncbi:nitroreductase family protein [Roseomonas rosulenta]|uniref:nitroreductase family protein n=1 Tax=Roseomonas rosulenta TaxID=2748667 RepID=UPI0018DFD277|nr:nitroreductase family protein [Roseomonas rosulenta]
MTDRIAPADHPIEHALAARWSPRSYDERPIPTAALAQCLEAARWAASCVNDQPWNYLVTRKAEEPEAHAKLLACLSPNNQGWAVRAPVLMLSVARTDFASSGKPNRHAGHDVGQASANLAAQAAALGLQAHQMAGFDAAAARAAFAIPEGYEPMAAITLGYPGPAAALPEALAARETAPRTRKPIAEFTHLGAWGNGGSPA